jgi:hypothetical protein
MRQQINNFGKKNGNDFEFGFAEELIATVLHPKRLEKQLKQYGYNIATEEYTDLE